MMFRCGPLLGVCLLGFVAACGESKGDDGGGKGGSPNETGGSAGSSAGVSGATSSGGSGATNGGTGASGSSSGGMSGSSGSGVGGSSAGSSSDGPCGDLTRNGRCAGNVYEWCDYFTGGVARLDCTPLGATCRALETQNYEVELNGCIAGPCETSEASCDGALARECELGEVIVTDCEKYGGPGSLCVASGTSAGCTRQECSPATYFTCAGDLLLICNEDGLLVIDDCARCDPEGTCVGEPGSEEAYTDCNRFSWGCEQ